MKNSRRNRARQERANQYTKIGREARVSKYAGKRRMPQVQAPQPLDSYNNQGMAEQDQ